MGTSPEKGSRMDLLRASARKAEVVSTCECNRRDFGIHWRARDDAKSRMSREMLSGESRRFGRPRVSGRELRERSDCALGVAIFPQSFRFAPNAHCRLNALGWIRFT